MTTQINILIVDDHPIAADGLISYLETADDIVVRNTCTRGEEVNAAITEYQPDVVLLDLELDGSQISGLEVAEMIQQLSPQTKILVISAFADQRHVLDALNIGVDGYVLKTSARLDLIEAVRRVAAGHNIFDPRVTKILQMFINKPESPVSHDENNDADLTSREWDVLTLIANNLSNEEIANELTVAVGTVKTHVSNILRKLSLKNRQEAQVWFHLNQPTT
ncbi:MAG: response regulator transcription factor, partial [Anaerolineales bacterium]|nr:response regulator transcription factor [Anaerolineales bacterium]